MQDFIAKGPARASDGMRTSAGPVAARTRRLFLCVLAAGLLPVLGLLAGCHAIDATIQAQGAGATGVERTRMIPVAAAWVAATDGVVATQRIASSAIYQRVLLPNATPLPGDNVLYMRVTRAAGFRGGALREADIADVTGGIPPPFEGFEGTTIRSRVDDAGALLWTQEWVSGIYLCVLAARRMTFEQRVIPAQGDMLDVVLRNCVQTDDPELALRPIRASAMLFPRGAYADGRAGMLSPLAMVGQ